MRRGRRDPERLHVGDTLDCWRVESIQPNQRLRLAAEMKLPGRAWLEFEVQPDGDGARLRQTATFDPLGLWGLAYWYGVWPLHQLVFAGMLRGLFDTDGSVQGSQAKGVSIRLAQSDLGLLEAVQRMLVVLAGVTTHRTTSDPLNVKPLPHGMTITPATVSRSVF